MGGTRSVGAKRLCDTCHNAVVMKGAADSEEHIRCHQLDRQPPFRVVECSSYADKTKPSLSSLYQVAWILETSKNNRSVGFTPWKEFKKKNPDEDVW